MTDTAASPRLGLFIVLFTAGLAGVASMVVTMVPQMLAGHDLPLPLWMIVLASFAQSSVLVALAVWIGLVTASSVGLHAPVAEAAISGYPMMPALKPQLVPGIVAGIASGLLLFVANGSAPDEWVEAQAQYYPPLVARMLYGGITEELLLRWGLMSAVVWLFWRFLQGRRGKPRAGFVWAAIVISALLFGAGHLPAVAAVIGNLNASVVLFIVGANSVFGIVFGWLYWRYGLESAMIAHAAAHLVNYGLGQ